MDLVPAEVARALSESWRPPRRSRRGAVSIQMLVILVPVLFAFMGFAVDLGRIYMVRGELKAAADAMALAAAGRLIGTESALDDAAAAAQLAVGDAAGLANRYDYGGRQVGETTGRIASQIEAPAFYETFEDATAEAESGTSASGGATARHVRVSVNAGAPLTFWGFLRGAQDLVAPVRVTSVAGVSAPLCQACGIDGIVFAALTPDDTEHFGLVPGSRYTLGYVCNGMGAPGPLNSTIQRIPYLLLNRLNQETEIFTDPATQAFRMGAGGLLPSTNEALSCMSVDGVETVWPGATPLACQFNTIPPEAIGFVCGLTTRFESGVAAECANIPEIDSATAPYQADTFVDDVEDYAAYSGSLRRVLTIPIVDSLTNPDAMTVLGFRQFLLQPIANIGNVVPSDENGRFIVTYLGSPVPLRQGRFSGCSITSGPGKVVLHQ